MNSFFSIRRLWLYDIGIFFFKGSLIRVLFLCMVWPSLHTRFDPWHTDGSCLIGYQRVHCTYFYKTALLFYSLSLVALSPHLTGTPKVSVFYLCLNTHVPGCAAHFPNALSGVWFCGVVPHLLSPFRGITNPSALQVTWMVMRADKKRRDASIRPPTHTKGDKLSADKASGCTFLCQHAWKSECVCACKCVSVRETSPNHTKLLLTLPLLFSCSYCVFISIFSLSTSSALPLLISTLPSPNPSCTSCHL